MTDQPGLAARRAAVDLLTGVTEAGRLLNEARLPESLAPEDRARAERLATETLRWAQRTDRLLGPHLRMLPWPRTHAILRLAVWEMASGAPAHGVVNAAVALAREHEKTAGQAGLVNAVLRKVSVVGWDGLPLPSLPKWLRKPLVKAYGKASVEAMEAAHAAGAPLDLTCAPYASDDVAVKLEAETLPTGSLRLARPGQISALPGYDAGHWWVQDAGAALPAQLLQAQPGERVLDLCAAPGGKTLQLAATGADVTALDVSRARMVRVQENLARCSLQAQQVVADALKWTPDAPFDAILLDAPCSATGTIRRHPDLPYAKDGAGLEDLTTLQTKLLDRALGWLKPGGRLVYCTCSLLPEEGEAQIAAALVRHEGVEVVEVEHPGLDAAWHTPHGLRLRPDFWSERGGIDGFFIAVLQNPHTHKERS